MQTGRTAKNPATGVCYTPGMKRSVREIIELAVFGLIALLIGTGLLWVAGWILAGLGWLMQIVAGLLWSLLRFIVPVAILAGLVYLLVRWVQQSVRNRKPPQVEGVPAEAPPSGPGPAVPAAAGTVDSWHTPASVEASAAAAVTETVTEPAADLQADIVTLEADTGGMPVSTTEPQVETVDVEVQAEVGGEPQPSDASQQAETAVAPPGTAEAQTDADAGTDEENA